MDLPQFHEKMAIRWIFPILLETILVRSKETADTHPQLCSLLEPSNQMPPGMLCSSFIQGRNLQLLNSSNSNVEKWRLIMVKEEKGLFWLSAIQQLLSMFSWKYYTLYTNLNAQTDRFCVVSTKKSGKRSHYNFPQTTKAGYRNTWHVRFQRYELK